MHKVMAERTISLRSYQVLPNQHPIWGMCVEGDLDGIQHMLETRQVSLYDQNPVGTTFSMVRIDERAFVGKK